MEQVEPTHGLVAGHGHQTLLLDVGFGGGVAASGVKPSVVDAQHHPVAKPLTAGHRALVETHSVNFSSTNIHFFEHTD